MIDYMFKHYDDLIKSALEHLQIVLVTLALSLVIAAALTVICSYSKLAARILPGILSMVYSVPSLAMFALLIPLTGLGQTTAIIVLVIYNQYLLLQNFLAGLNGVEKSIVEAAAGMGMTPMQTLIKIKLPLSRKSFIAGIRIAMVATISIATIAASINAGGLGTILFDGLRTMNPAKILWGSLLSALLAILIDRILRLAEKFFER
ncbi:ABC transporter permease [Petralouisia muris]|uniref:ABC transporter permease n=1 Tax=Petralouisia muris TaxID=3032872 RepID=A0AC61S2Z5_9FIRM|nr:ABC transporter permease [Petralouisia muris]TGY98403.1 ABC transporter permease [Petralouisia muris]